MKSSPAVKNRPAPPNRPRGRPRSLQARRAILEAAHELLQEGGLASVTIEGIAARAGVGKPTIYRSWPNAHAVAMAALMEGSEAPGEPRRRRSEARPRSTEASGSIASRSAASSSAALSPASSGSALAALRAQLHEVARVFSAPLGRSVTLMIAAAEQETELSKAFRNHFILARRNEGRELLSGAIATGEVRGDIDLDVALDLIYAPVFYRLLMGHAPLTGRFIDDTLDLALKGLSASVE